MFAYRINNRSITADDLWGGFCDKYGVRHFESDRKGVTIFTTKPLDEAGVFYLRLHSLGFDIKRS